MSNIESNKIPTYKLVRELPKNVRVVKKINGIDIYNMNVFQNIMSWNQQNLDTPALEYFGNQITYGQLPGFVSEYEKGFDSLGIKKNSIVTMSLPVSNEYYLSLFATCNMGAISNNVNFLFLRNDLAKYTLEKNSDTIIILDLYLPLIYDQLEKSQIKNVILTSLDDYLPEERKDYFSDLSKLPEKIRKELSDTNRITDFTLAIRRMKGINFIKMSEIIEFGKHDNRKVVHPEVDIEKDSIYSYTSGTTGDPKCIVFKEQSPNAIIEQHKGLDLRDNVGDRSLLVIPASHATGMFYATYLQMAKGKTMVLQPIYDKHTFATDLKNLNIDHTLAAGSFYLAAVADDKIEDGSLHSNLRACSGGEPITKSNVILINDWLKRKGVKEKLAIGGGAGELGSSTLTSYELDQETKINETGLPIPGVYVKIVDPATGKEVEPGQRGIIHMSSAAMADRYLNNPDATKEAYYVDENGVRWFNLRDIAVQNKDGSYTMLGRSSDSFVDENGNTIYLFDIEYELSVDDPAIEWEISTFKTDKKYAVVAQVVLKNEFIGREKEAIKYLCDKYKLDSIKIYDTFPTSEVTGKRDYKQIKADGTNYYCVDENDNLIKINYTEGREPEIEFIDEVEETIQTHKTKRD